MKLCDLWCDVTWEWHEVWSDIIQTTCSITSLGSFFLFFRVKSPDKMALAVQKSEQMGAALAQAMRRSGNLSGPVTVQVSTPSLGMAYFSRHSRQWSYQKEKTDHNDWDFDRNHVAIVYSVSTSFTVVLTSYGHIFRNGNYYLARWQQEQHRSSRIPSCWCRGESGPAGILDRIGKRERKRSDP